MKILLFTTYFYPYTSGLTEYPLKILTHLAKKHEVTVLTFRHHSTLQESEIHNGIRIIRMPYLFKLSKGFISPQSLAYFYKYLKSTDIVFLNLPNFEGIILALLARLYGKKLFSIYLCEVYLTGSVLANIINLCLNISVFCQLLLSQKVVSMTEDYLKKKWVFNPIKNKVTFTIPPIKKLPVAESRLREFSKLKKDRVWIGFAGRIAREKGLEYLIEAISRSEFGPFRDGEGMSNFSLVFAGPSGKDVVGEKDYYLKIKKLLAEKNIPHHFFGFLPDADLGAFYKSLNVLVLPSINKTEAFGMVQAEAMLLGTPAVASNLPGIRVPILTTKMGKIADPQKTILFARAITEVVTKRNDYSNQTLITRAAKVFNSEKTFRIYDRLLD